jgi:hypothetical protein
MGKGSAVRKHLCEGRQEFDGSCSPLAQRKSGIRAGVPYIQAPPSDALGEGTFAHKQVLTALTFTYFSFHDSVFVTQTPEQVGCDGGGKCAILILGGRFTSNRVVTQLNVALDTA